MTKYRKRLDIIADMLTVVSDGARKTHIMYTANLSYTLLIRYLTDVIDMGLVRNENGNIFKLTAKGSDFLQEFNGYRKHRGKVEEQVSDIKYEEAMLMNRFLNDESMEYLFKKRMKDSILLKPLSVEVIIPTLNEAQTIGYILDEVGRYANDVLVIDGQSVDGTCAIVKQYGARMIIQSKRGKGFALREAFKKSKGDIVVMLDADGSMKPSEIPLFIEAIVNGADVAKGSRFLGNSNSEDITWLRYLGNQMFVKLVNLLWSENYTDLCYGFCAFNRSAIEKLSPLLEAPNFEIETEIIIKAKKLGLKIVEVPSVELRRRFGKSRLRTIRDGFSIFLTIIKHIFYDIEASYR